MRSLLVWLFVFGLLCLLLASCGRSQSYYIPVGSGMVRCEKLKESVASGCSSPGVSKVFSIQNPQNVLVFEEE